MAELGKLVGKNVRKYRNKRGLTQEVLAQLVGYAQSEGISRIENGDERVPLYRLQLIADVLRIPITTLFEGVERPEDTKLQYIRDLDQLSETNRALITRIVSQLADVEQEERAKAEQSKTTSK